MKTFCDIKFTDSLTQKQIDVLTKRFGFRFFSKNVGNWTLYRKYYNTDDPNQKALDEINNQNIVGEATRAVLARECNRICEPFYCINGVVKEDVISALTSYANMKTNPLHRQWILTWMKNNVEEVTNDNLPF